MYYDVANASSADDRLHLSDGDRNGVRGEGQLTFEAAVRAFPHLLLTDAAIVECDGRGSLGHSGRFRPYRYHGQLGVS